jgi:hypothetical protein
MCVVQQCTILYVCSTAMCNNIFVVQQCTIVNVCGTTMYNNICL